MPIPPLEPNGYLCPARHVATAADMQTSFVAPFTTSASRAPLMARWESHARVLNWLIAVAAHWVGGSFVSSKVDPADIDTVAHCDGPTFDALPEEQRALILYMCAGRAARPYWGLDSFAVFHYPPGHANRPMFEAAIAYWDDLWCHTREDAAGNKHPRGYLEIR